MLGAYTTYVVQTAMPGHIGISILVAIPVAFLVSDDRDLIERAPSSAFMETLETCSRHSCQPRPSTAGRSIFRHSINRCHARWMSGTMQINDALESYNRLYIVIFTPLVFATIMAVLNGPDLVSTSELFLKTAQWRSVSIHEWVCHDVRSRLRHHVAGVAL